VRERAESAAKRIRGVKSVTNSITLKPKVAPYEIRRKIEDAFCRSAELDASRISVQANGSEVILRGTVNPSNNPDVTLASSTKDAAIMRAVIEIAHTLGAQVVAEGVEIAPAAYHPAHVAL
jgi:hypothetical protein